MTTVTELDSPARFLGRYANGFGAGAFATPTAKELAARPELVRDFTSPDHRTVLVVKDLRVSSRRTDFTGTPYTLPAGARVVTHLARTPGAPLPPLGDIDYLYGYADDRELSGLLVRAGWRRRATQVQASSEMKHCWTRSGPVTSYHPWDVATATQVELGAELPTSALAREAHSLDQAAWYDDFPFYSDGSWSSINLRGFRPDDPTWGIKPSEMPKQWQADHPEAASYECDWTVLAARTPVIRAWVESVPWWTQLERVRLLMMDGETGSTLKRHTDVQDRGSGPQDGHIVRFHMPLVTDPAIKMSVWGLDGKRRDVHLAGGGCYYLDARKPHAVSNPTTVRRIHLVVDVVSNDEVRRRIADGGEL